MGDYTKLIVHAEISAERSDFETELKKLGLCESAYHCDGVVEVIEERSYNGRRYLCITLVGQTKYGERQDEFLEWLKPFVIQGSGPKDAWAFQLSEYFAEPTIWQKYAVEE